MANLRVCPTFKLYWVEGCQVVTIKRHDYNMPFITPEGVFSVIGKVYPNFDSNIHVIKYRDAEDLIDLSKTDTLSFQFNAKFAQVSFFIFTSKQDALDFIGSWTTILRPQKFAEFRSREFSNAVQVVDRDRPAQASYLVGSKSNPFPKSAPPNKSVHPSVTCDLCCARISASRYKCLECTNYDLCTMCERKNFHDHLMIRIPISFCEAQGVLYQSVVAGLVSSAQRNIPHTID